MATPKKKPVSKKSSATKVTKVTANKAPRKTTKKSQGFKSFKQSAEPTPFMTFSFTNQTLYWLILSIIVVALGAWVIYLNAKVQDIYDQIDANSNIVNTQSAPVKKSVPKQ